LVHTKYWSEEDALARFLWTGTHDPVPWLTVPFAIAQLQAARAAGLQEAARVMFATGSDLVTDALEAPPGPDTAPHLRSYAVDMGAVELATRLRANRIEAWVEPWQGRTVLRLSGWLHNTLHAYEDLAALLRRVAVRAAG